MMPLCLHAPAKLNLFLAITGRRSDGFHSLVSLAVPLDFGDELELRITDRETGDTRLRVEGEASAAEVPSGPDNLVLRAASAFREASGFARPVEFVLKKRVPVGAGLGGGSSDAVAALRGLNTLAAKDECALDEKTLCALAAKLGADCAFFACGKPAIMRGRGERIEPLNEAAAKRLGGGSLFVCKPAFGVSTAWAYGEMATRAASVEGGDYYVAEAEAERLCGQWLTSGVGAEQPLESLTFNNMESVVFRKYPALPVLAATFRERFGLILRMSGSGSACFAFLPKETRDAAANTALVRQLSECVRELWGPSAFSRVVRVRTGA
ncbi:4-(cytidine 5'-diphospho)-2-C-methyl-D-erythritol kinase [Cephaloticoccus capnophilus]|nr:4-(cytidine 5'-diphospho)-2-C-methyl-D-erythritol kinase [Cephaloticoccus capnophilus]